MKHTPAPWIAEQNHAYQVQIYAEGGAVHAFVQGRDGAQLAANARLIASAPEMYETIQRLMEQVTETGTVNLHEGIRAIALLARIDGTEG